MFDPTVGGCRCLTAATGTVAQKPATPATAAQATRRATGAKQPTASTWPVGGSAPVTTHDGDAFGVQRVPDTDRPTRPYSYCDHPQTTHWHGTYACYALDRCRCDDCQQARSRYGRLSTLRNMGLRPTHVVDAEPARRRVHQLMEQGMGLKRIAEVSGVPHGSLWKLIYGKGPKGNRQRSRRLTAGNAEALLSTSLDLADGARVPADEAWAIVNELQARGWTKAAIGREVHGPDAVSLQLSTDTVTAGHLRTLRRLLEQPVPTRRHPTGSTWQPKGRPARNVPATTPGVTTQPDRGAGRLSCRICGDPFADHPLSGTCRPTTIREGAWR